MLARGAAAEVVTRDQHLGAPGLRLLEDEVRPGTAVGLVTPVREEPTAQAGAVGDLQKTGGDDLIGVDVLPRQDDGARAQCAERFHGLHLKSSRGSVTWPVTAAAA